MQSFDQASSQGVDWWEIWGSVASVASLATTGLALAALVVAIVAGVAGWRANRAQQATLELQQKQFQYSLVQVERDQAKKVTYDVKRMQLGDGDPDKPLPRK